jgi:hypothetical protein
VNRSHVMLVYFSLLMLIVPAMSAQTVDIGIFATGGPVMEVRVRPTDSIPGWPLSNIVFTIRWLDSYGVNLGTPFSTYYSVVKQGPMIVSGSYRYQKFAAATAQYIFWSPGVELPVMTVDATQTGVGTGTFELVNDGWTGPNRGDFYSEISGLNRTGIIYHGAAANVMLPLELTSFHARVVDRRVLLEWTVSGSSPGVLFRVERAADGGQWEHVATIPADAVPDVSYRCVDERLVDERPNDTRRYRLYHLAPDGGRALLYEASIDGSREPSLAATLDLYPNPARNALHVRFTLRESGAAALAMFDVAGRMVRQLFVAADASGEHDLLVSLGGIVPGGYVLRLQNTSGVIQRRCMVAP